MSIKNKTYNQYSKNTLDWIDPDKHPPAYELVKIKTNYRELNGWWTGFEWFVRNNFKDEKVLYWKKTYQNNIHH